MITIYCGVWSGDFSNNIIRLTDNADPYIQIKTFDDFIKINADMEIFTNSPYILNYLNLLIIRFDKGSDLPSINYDNLDVILCTKNGKETIKESIKMKNERLIDTNYHSDIINEIYEEYNALKNL